MNIQTLRERIIMDSMELYCFQYKTRQAFKFRCCKFVRSYTVIDLRPKKITAKYSGRAVFTVN